MFFKLGCGALDRRCHAQKCADLSLMYVNTPNMRLGVRSIEKFCYYERLYLAATATVLMQKACQIFLKSPSVRCLDNLSNQKDSLPAVLLI